MTIYCFWELDKKANYQKNKNIIKMNNHDKHVAFKSCLNATCLYKYTTINS